MEKLINMYALFDNATGQYGMPFVSVNDKTAKRELFYFLAKNPQISPDDIELWSLGMYNNVAGVVSSDLKKVEEIE